MNRSNSKRVGGIRSIWVQASALVALGLLMGTADALVRPIKLGRNTTEFTLPVTPAPGGTAKPATTGAETSKPVEPVQTAAETPKAQPAEPAESGVPTSAEAFKPTPKDQLPKGQITLAEAKAAFDAGETNFVDARPKEKFADGHIPGAVRLELVDFQNQIPAKLGLLPKENLTIVYCNGGHCDESERVAEMLENSGYARIFIIHDGFPGWKALGYPVETGEDFE